MIHVYWLLLSASMLPVLPLLWLGRKGKRLWWIGLLPCLALLLYCRFEISSFYERTHARNEVGETGFHSAWQGDKFDNSYQIPVEALFGNTEVFLNWKHTFQQWYTNRFDSILKLTPTGHTTLSREKFNGLTLISVEFTYPSDSPLHGKPGGGILAVPDTIVADIPIIAIHGHEEAYWGQHPYDLFKDQKWPFEIARSGYIVWAPVSMYHDEIEDYGETYGYPLTWSKIISEGMSYITNKQILSPSPKTWIATGLSAGAQTGYALMAYRADIRCGVFAGAEQNLDFLRREYRIKGHANCWDVPGIASFSAIMSLIPPRPVQFQTGRYDPFFPNGRALEKQGDSFPGTSRGQYSTESEFSAVRSIYALFDREKYFSVLIHDGGHEFNVEKALEFIHDVEGK